MSGEKFDRILRGPPLGPVPDCSLAEFLVPRIRSHPEDHVIQVDAETGAVQTAEELLTTSVRLSEGLKRMGLKENDVVGMACRNSFEANAIVLGTWLAGAVISPTDASMKLAEIKHFLALTKPKFIFAEEETASNVVSAVNLLSISATVVLASKSKGSGNAHPTFEEVLVEADVKGYRPQPVGSPSDQLVAILPSSGTSGLQKGVGITHTNFVFQILNQEHLKSIVASSCLQISQFYWVTGVLTFLMSLSMGTKRIVMRTSTPTTVLRAIDEHKPKWTLMAPLFLLSITMDSHFDQFDVSSLKTIFIGGSPFTPNMAQKLKGKWDHANIVQAYGTTEVSGSVSVRDESGDVFSLGRVTPGVQVKVVDTETEGLLTANALGEIRIFSPGIMKCYVGNEEATREAKDAEGWIRSGDLGYYDDSMQLYFVDRIKEMIKVMNMQIAPVEVESTILSVAGVAEAGVVGITGEGGDRLLALVVKQEGSSVTEEDIHSHVANTLSDYKKLTGGVYFVESLPKTNSGKLRRSELKKKALELFSQS